MDLISLIKEKLTDSVFGNISEFLGEQPEKVNAALNSVAPTALGGIIQKSNTAEGVSKLLEILKEGGHTGDILDNLPRIVDQFDKTQMLITIGSNIANHFFGDKLNNIVETLASVGGIRKTSSFSLFGLAMPLVLGALGKVVNKENLGIAGLTNVLNDQKDYIQKALPPVLYNQLNFKSAAIINETNQEVKIANEPPKLINTVRKEDTTSSWLPWLLLLLLGLGAIAWVKGCKNYFVKQSKEDSLLHIANILKIDSTIISDTNAIVVAPKKIDTTTTKIITPIIPQVKAPVKPLEPSPQQITTPIKTEVITGDFGERLKNSSSNFWIAMNGLTFKKNSAELIETGQVATLAVYLKKYPKAKVQIGSYADSERTLAEDRAYALREQLIEDGIADNKIILKNEIIANPSSSNAKIGIKIIK